jgi:polysaccharide biosynthesis/export protein
MGCARAKLVFGAVLLSLLVTAGARAQEKPVSQDKPVTVDQVNQRIQHLAGMAGSKPAEITISGGDMLHVDVFDVPDLSRDVRVNVAGDMSFPLLAGKIHAGGLTPYQLQEKLAKLLLENGLVSHPQVSVLVKEQNSAPISVVGAVTRPGVFQETRPTTLLEAIAEAGGLAPDAGDVVTVTRAPLTGENGGLSAADAEAAAKGQTVITKLKDLLETGDSAFNIYVHGGDVISVAHAGIIYIAGAVQSPGGFVLRSEDTQLTTLKALALARGLIFSAKGDQSVIIRNGADGQKLEINVRLNQIMARKAEDVPLYANDILFVPDSNRKRALAKAGNAAIAITSGLAIYSGTRF